MIADRQTHRQTDRQTNTLITILRSQSGAEYLYIINFKASREAPAFFICRKTQVLGATLKRHHVDTKSHIAPGAAVVKKINPSANPSDRKLDEKSRRDL